MSEKNLHGNPSNNSLAIKAISSLLISMFKSLLINSSVTVSQRLFWFLVTHCSYKYIYI